MMNSQAIHRPRAFGRPPLELAAVGVLGEGQQRARRHARRLVVERLDRTRRKVFFHAPQFNGIGIAAQGFAGAPNGPHPGHTSSISPGGVQRPTPARIMALWGIRSGGTGLVGNAVFRLAERTVRC